MALTYTVPDWVAGDVLDAADLNSRFADVQGKFSAAIYNADIATDAAIDVTKLSARYEHMSVTLGVTGVITGGWPSSATAPIITHPLYNDGNGNWEVVAATYICNDIGGGLGTFALRWGTYTAGAFTNVTTVSSSGALTVTTTTAMTGISNTALAAGTNRILAIIGTAADATTMDAQVDWFTCTVFLRRVIAAS